MPLAAGFCMVFCMFFYRAQNKSCLRKLPVISYNQPMGQVAWFVSFRQRLGALLGVKELGVYLVPGLLEAFVNGLAEIFRFFQSTSSQLPSAPA